MTLPDRYTRPAMVFHWTIAALIIANVVMIWVIDDFPEAWGRPIINLHKSIGLTVLGLGLMRILWRVTHAPPPDLAAPKWQHAVAHLVHFALYVIIIGAPLSGWMHDFGVQAGAAASADLLRPVRGAADRLDHPDRAARQGAAPRRVLQLARLVRLCAVRAVRAPRDRRAQAPVARQAARAAADVVLTGPAEAPPGEPRVPAAGGAASSRAAAADLGPAAGCRDAAHRPDRGAGARDPGSARVLMGRRHRGHAYLPDKWVFPGGRIDRADFAVPAATELRPDVAALLERSAPARRARALACAAIRETFEETGLLLARPAPPVKRPGVWGAVPRRRGAPRPRRARLRRPGDHPAAAHRGASMRASSWPMRARWCRSIRGRGRASSTSWRGSTGRRPPRSTCRASPAASSPKRRRGAPTGAAGPVPPRRPRRLSQRSALILARSGGSGITAARAVLVGAVALVVAAGAQLVERLADRRRPRRRPPSPIASPTTPPTIERRPAAAARGAACPRGSARRP